MSASNTVYFELQKSKMSSVIPGLNMKSAFETELVWYHGFGCRLPAAESCKSNSTGVLHIFLVMEETNWQNKRIIFFSKSYLGKQRGNNYEIVLFTRDLFNIQTSVPKFEEQDTRIKFTRSQRNWFLKVTSEIGKQ